MERDVRGLGDSRIAAAADSRKRYEHCTRGHRGANFLVADLLLGQVRP